MFRTSDKSELTREEEYDLKSKYPEDSNKKERDKIAIRMIAHPNSVLGKSVIRFHEVNTMMLQYHCRISTSRRLMRFSRSFCTQMGSIRTLITLSQQKEDFVSWELNDGSKIRNIVFEKMEDDPTIRGKGRKPMRKVSSDFQLNCIRMSVPVTKKQLAYLQTLFIPSMHVTCGHS